MTTGNKNARKIISCSATEPEVHIVILFTQELDVGSTTEIRVRYDFFSGFPFLHGVSVQTSSQEQYFLCLLSAHAESVCRPKPTCSI